MSNNLSKNWLFIKESFKTFKTQGSLVPSSKFLSRQILKPIKTINGMVVVELGAGTGVFTKEIISQLSANGTLVVIEINHKLIEYLKETATDKRVIIIEGSAENLSEHLKKLNLKKADYIISGIPFGNLSYKTVHKILTEINYSLSDNGVYIQFQYLLTDWLHIRKIFKTIIAGYELRNFPPAFLYHCRKKQNI